MRLRVLDDVRPGYAQLAFDGPLIQPTLQLSVRSQQEGGFLGPDGSWQKSAHFFAASRIEGDERSALYRVGPEIVNHIRELDIVEFASDDGTLHIETTWENAVPQMPKVPGGRPGHSFYGVQSQPLETTPAYVEPSEPISNEEETAEQIQSPPEPEVEPEPPAPVPPPLAEETIARPPEPPRVPRDRRQTTGKPKKSLGFVPLLIALLVLAGAGFAAYKFVPCEWLPQGYCPVDQHEVDARQKARVCIFYKSQGGLDCDIAKECIEPYLTAFPKGPSRPELETKAKASNDVCKQMVDTAQTAFACIDDLKKRGRSRCDVKVACTQTFQSLYPIGPMRRKIDAATDQAQVDCECEHKPSSCENSAQEAKEPETNAEEESAWQEANECARDPAKKCASHGCYADYLSKFVSGLHKAEAQTQADTIAKTCAAVDEKAALQAARDCARGPRRCTAHCYASFIAKYGSSGADASDAHTEAAQIENECKSAHDEDDAWLSAKRCAATASACDVEACYKNAYLTRYGINGTHRADANLEISRAQTACQKLSQQTLVADGKYWGRSLAACGAKTDFGVNVDVKGNHITWEHDFLGVKYQWTGIIDPSGNVSAKVANSSGTTATGVFIADGEKTIQMKYPQCTSEPVQLEIRGKFQ